MANGISTAGITLGYVAEATANVRPTSGYVGLAGLKEVPDLSPSPESLETTTLAELEYKTYITGLKDLGGALSFTFNFTQSFVVAWDAVLAAYTTAKAAGRSMWWKISIPGITKAAYFQGIPSELGMPGATVNSVLEIMAYITQSSGLVWA
jgi:hypothetical protein